MSLNVQMGNIADPPEKVNKTFTPANTYGCVLKEQTSILRPVIKILSNDNVFNYNYMYIQEFGRYYFIDDIMSDNNNFWEVSGHVDVLKTYATEILNNEAVVKRQQNKYNLYLNDVDFQTYNNDLIQTKKFTPSAFTKNLNYILVVNGS